MNKQFIKALGVSVLLMAGMCQSSLAADDPDSLDVRFELLNHEGQTVTLADFEGKNVLLAFGFTRCQHICPMMAANMGLALRMAEQKATGIFISVDTERDTPRVAHEYASGFNKAMIGLSGSHAQVREAANNFGVSFVVTKSQKAYTVEHTADIFLIGPDGKLIDTFALNADPALIAAAMKP